MEEAKVIYDDEDVIGMVKEIRKCFMKHLGDVIFDTSIGIEEKTNDLILTAKLIEKLNNEDDRTIIRVTYNQMGNLDYKYLTWEE